MKRYLEYAVLLMCMCLALTFGIFYKDYSSRRISEESGNHLQEVQAQIKATIVSITKNHWNILHEWEDYLAEKAANDPQVMKAYLEENQKRRGFTEFYFLSEDGDYVTSSGKEGYLDLGHGLRKLMMNGEDVIVDTSLSSGESIVVFAVPVETTTLGDFSYSAIAMAYTMQDIAKTLNINMFEGKGNCYVIYQDGRVLLESAQKENQISNFVTYLTDNAVLRDKNLADVIEDWIGRHSGVVRYAAGGTTYYLAYQPIGFSDWLLLSTVPVEIMNAAMNQYTKVTLSIIGMIFILLMVSMILVLVGNSQKRIREQKLELEFQGKMFDVLAQNTNDVFMMYDADIDKATYVSSNIQRVLGVSAQDVFKDIHMLFASFVDKTSRSVTRESILSISEDVPWVSERMHQNKDNGEVRWYKTLIRRTPTEGRKNIFVIAMFDQTEDKKMHQALETALEAANAANEAKRNFLANMSHDIRTPMNAIMGFSFLLSTEVDNPVKVREYTKKINISSQNLLELINDILDMSKIESGKTALNNMEFSLPTLLEQIAEIMAPQAKLRHQNFEIRTKGVLPEYLLGDKIRLNQILVNLISNALKYTKENGWIRVTVEAIGDTKHNRAKLRFTVEDNGCGMSPEFLDHIFDPFVRERKMHANEIQGTGLGMPIANTLVKLMGGTIQVQSTPDVGSVFTVELVFDLAKHDQDINFWSRNGINRVLVVDDEEEVCMDIRLILQGVGIETDYATNGYQALDMVQKNHDKGEDYAVVLLDWKMPGMDGQETARRIRQIIGADLPILMITAFAAEQPLIEYTKAAGINKFLTKPFFLSYFQLALEEIFEEQKGEVLPQQQEVSLTGIKVLAAEDHIFNAELLEEIMELLGISCDMTANGQEALERYTQAPEGYYDLIILDVQMPVMDGHEAARRIRSSGRSDSSTIPIIAMTANAFEDDVKASLEAGMDVHAAKPIGKDKLTSLIHQYCKKERETGHDT